MSPNDSQCMPRVGTLHTFLAHRNEQPANKGTVVRPCVWLGPARCWRIFNFLVQYPNRMNHRMGFICTPNILHIPITWYILHTQTLCEEIACMHAYSFTGHLLSLYFFAFGVRRAFFPVSLSLSCASPSILLFTVFRLCATWIISAFFVEKKSVGKSEIANVCVSVCACTIAERSTESNSRRVHSKRNFSRLDKSERKLSN